jgi:hypothetical protein
VEEEKNMRRLIVITTITLLGISVGHSAPSGWAINATGIEACSCPHFCMCYFNSHPAAHHDQGKMQHYCRFNIAYKVNKGNYGATDLTGAKLWLSGDLGGDFSTGQMDWVVVTFDKSVTAEQRQALGDILPHVFPVKWKSFQVAEGNIDTWTFDKDQAHATLNGGKTAEVKLKSFHGMTDDPVVLKNVKYWGTPRNNGFIMMPSEVEAYRESPKAFEFNGSNGFILTFDITSEDVAKSTAAARY